VEDSTGKEVAVASVLVELTTMGVELERLSDAEGVKELSVLLEGSEISELESLLEVTEDVNEEMYSVSVE
jgi:hypothetical protein